MLLTSKVDLRCLAVLLIAFGRPQGSMCQNITSETDDILPQSNDTDSLTTAVEDSTTSASQQLSTTSQPDDTSSSQNFNTTSPPFSDRCGLFDLRQTDNSCLDNAQVISIVILVVILLAVVLLLVVAAIFVRCRIKAGNRIQRSSRPPPSKDSINLGKIEEKEDENKDNLRHIKRRMRSKKNPYKVADAPGRPEVNADDYGDLPSPTELDKESTDSNTSSHAYVNFNPSPQKLEQEDYTPMDVGKRIAHDDASSSEEEDYVETETSSEGEVYENTGVSTCPTSEPESLVQQLANLRRKNTLARTQDDTEDDNGLYDNYSQHHRHGDVMMRHGDVSSVGENRQTGVSEDYDYDSIYVNVNETRR